MITVQVPAMTARADVRAISASISDVPGVQTLQADLATRTVQVTGPADPVAVTAAVTAAGYTAADHTVDPATDGSPPTGTSRTGGRPVDTFFSTDITDLPPATRPEVLALGDGDELEGIVEAALAANAEAAERIRGGNMKAIGAIIGHVMRETKGRADGGEVTRLVRAKLGL